MADKSTIKIKRSSTSNAPSTLNTGELAYSFGAGTYSDNGGRLFVGGMGAGSDLNSATGAPIVVGGKYFTDMLDHTPGVLTASSALIVDSSKKLDELLVDDLSLNASTLSSTTDLKINTLSGIELNGTVNKFSSGPYAGTSLDFQSYELILRQDRGGGISLKVGAAGSVTSTVTLNNDGSLTVPGTINTLDNTDIVLNPNGTGKVKIANTWTLPRSAGTNGYILTTNGSDTATWSAPASSSVSLASDNSGSGTVSTGGTLTVQGGNGIVTSVTGSTFTISSTGAGGYTSTATGGTTTTLTSSSSANQFFTGTTTQTVKLPSTSTLTVGQEFFITNNSTGALTIQTSAAGAIVTQAAGTQITFTVASTGAQTWVYEYTGAQSITGSGNLVFSDSPTLVTPTLGVASATTINKVTITAPATAATLTIANNKTFTVNNTITLAGTDSTTITLPSTTGTVALDNQAFYIGTTSVAINRSSASLALTGVSIDGSAGSVANKLTIGTGLSGTEYNGSSAVTIALASAYGDTTNPYGTKTTKYFLAGPVSGADAAPTFRAIEATDIPTLNQNTSGSAASLSATLVVASGGTGTTTGSITGTGSLSFTAGGSDTNVNLVPQGTGTVDVSSKRITSVGTPTQASDAATKGYVDAVKQALDVKDSVRVATTANLSADASGTGSGKTLTNNSTQAAITIDSIALSSGDRVLVKNQTTTADNGIYTVTTVGSASVNWVLTRATDADNSPAGEVTAGMFTFVEEGTVNADSGWVLTTNNSITLDTTGLVFTQFSGAGQITAGNGLTKSGNTLDVVGTTDRIIANSDSIDISANYVGQTSITTLGTIGTGVWNGTLIGSTYGGTGVNNGSKTITLGGNLTTSGAYNTTLTVTADSNVTLPTTGTLAATTNTTFGTGSTWNGNTIGSGYGGTGFSTYAKGDLVYASAADTLSKLTAGDAYTFLQMNASGVPVWGAIDGGTY